MSFYIGLEQLARKYAPEPIVKVGDIVETVWGYWKRPHKVKITNIEIEILPTNRRFGRKDNESWEAYNRRVPPIGVGLQYIAARLKSDGTEKEVLGGIVLTNFTTSSGENWTWNNTGFNHYGLTWTLAKGKRRKEA